MFPLHDRVRRRICIAGFFALAVAPTVAVLGLALAWRLPSHVRAEADRLGRQLGMDVSLAGVEHPLPGVIRYRGLDLSSPETGRTVAHCLWLEAQNRMLADPQGKLRPTLVLRAGQPEVDVAEMAELGQLANGAIRLRLGNSRCDVQLNAKQLQLKTGDDVRTLTDVRGTVQTTTAGTQAMLRFRLAGNETGEPARLWLGRNRQTEPAADWFEVDTGGSALPCDLLALAIAPMRSLGASARFRGCLNAALVTEGWQGEISGQFSDVELDRLVTDRLPYQLSGTAHVEIEHAQFRGGRMEEIRGRILAGPGRVSRSLVDAAATQLGLGGGPPLAAPDAVVPYEQLAFKFAANAYGLVLEGHCRAGAVMCDGRGQLLCSLHQPRPIAALLRTLAPRTAEQFPVSPETDWLARRLPLARQP
ncbi:MAG: hypothetical protein NTW96_06505 [Planctomycetia bacterium]|nr:hypothetical protein [Planctomycetia bacterium]